MKHCNLLIITLLLVFAGFCNADNAANLAEENAKLKKRVDNLEKELADLKKIVYRQADIAQKQPQSQPEPKPQTKPESQLSDMPQLSNSDLQKIYEMIEKKTDKKKPVWSNLDIQIYGYIKADASYDTSRTNSGNYVIWVDRENVRTNDSEFNITANETRLGMKITGPKENRVKTGGRIEIDFYGGGAENKAKLQLRHAYLKLDWPEERFSIIAGQTSDVISPLNPYTLNYTVLWDVGNIGYRRPQLRLTKSFTCKNNLDVKLDAALTRTIGDDELSSVAGQKSGEDSGFPTFQGRVGFTFPALGYKPTTVGFSGHWGKEEYDAVSGTTAKSEEFETWSFNVDLTQPVNKYLTVKGEFFTGANLDTFFGGIGQGVRSTTAAGVTTYLEEIDSKGGWIAVSLGPWDKWRFNVGAGTDQVDNSDVNAGGRTLNQAVFGNVIYSVNKNTEIGFEISQWRTEYKGTGDASNTRAQTSFIYKF
ncbi:MAG: hypothetical protein FVQ80_09450 [Planctomycetes bacterium]|nr:hypothetical protein [Planctomycetota bacterium]